MVPSDHEDDAGCASGIEGVSWPVRPGMRMIGERAEVGLIRRYGASRVLVTEAADAFLTADQARGWPPPGRVRRPCRDWRVNALVNDPPASDSTEAGGSCR